MQIFALAALTVFSMAFRVGAAASPQDDYLQIYVMINEGDKLSQGGQNSQAREKYETALTRLEKLKNENPEWEPTIVKYRIKYLSDKLANLKTAKESATPPPAAPVATPAPTAPAPLSEKSEPPAPAPTPVPAKIEAPAAPAPVPLSDDPSTLRQRIIQLTGDLESARTELKQAKADLDQALTDKKGLQEKLSSAAPGDANVAALQQENTALRTKLASTEESLKKAAGGDMAGEMSSLRGQVDSLEKKLAEANAKSAELTRANEDYKKQIADLTGKLQMAGTAGKSDSTLAKENAMLRSILDRQLKEQARREAARRLVLDEFKNLAVSTEALKTQMEVLSSPLVSLSAEEEGMLKVSAPSLVAPEPEAPAAATGAAAGTTTLSSAAEKPASPESYAEKPRPATEVSRGGKSPPGGHSRRSQRCFFPFRSRHRSRPTGEVRRCHPSPEPRGRPGPQRRQDPELPRHLLFPERPSGSRRAGVPQSHRAGRQLRRRPLQPRGDLCHPNASGQRAGQAPL